MDETPVISVVIRSYERGAAVIELIEAVLRQRGAPPFEIVVVEQSQRLADDHMRRLRELARDPRVRILHLPPLGGPRARNVGARAARGDIVLFMDDDDLPERDDWLACHAANFADPKCLGVTGGQLDLDKPAPPYPNMASARRKVCSYVPILMWHRSYTGVDQPRRADNLTGGNTAIRRSVLARVGLWDECTPVEDELSFNYRLRKEMKEGEYLLFDPVPRMIRRRGIPGGMGKREGNVVTLGAAIFEFTHRVVRYYFPVRFFALYPIYMACLYVVCCDWIWNDLHGQGGAISKSARSALVFVGFPILWAIWMVRVIRNRLEDGPARPGFERAPALVLPAEDVLIPALARQPRSTR